MKIRSAILLSVITAATLACSFEYIPPPSFPSLQAASTADRMQEEEPLVIPSLPPPPPTATFRPAPPTSTRVNTRTPTPIVPMLMSAGENLNCRAGPSPDWAVDGILPRGTWTGIYGQDVSGDWYQIATPNFPGRYCYVAKALVLTSGNLRNVAVLPQPQALVTKLNVELLPDRVSVPCASLPYTFQVKVEITVNGPTEVTFQRSFDDGNAEPPETFALKSSGKHVFKYAYSFKTAGSHWALIELYAPNFRTSKDTATLSCTP